MRFYKTKISPFEFNIFKDGHGSVDTFIDHRRKKNDGEIEPELEEMARENPRGNFQPVRGYVSKAAELVSEGLQASRENEKERLITQERIMREIEAAEKK